MSSELTPIPLVSVIILTLNEETNLPACIASLGQLPCELFVVDSGSNDDTLRIAREYGAQVFEHPFDNYAAQRNWALANLPIKTEWVLHLDADERLTAELSNEITTVLNVRHGGVNGFMLRQRTVFMGRWIKHGGHYPSYHLRLFRRGRGRCEDRLYDQHFVVDGKVAKLRSDYIDVLTSDLDSWLKRHVRWANLEAREVHESSDGGYRVHADPFGTPIEHRRWLRDRVYGRAPLFVRPFAYWFYRYFLRLGFLDGKQGFVFHFLQGLWFRMVVDIKIDELRRSQKREGPEG